MKKTDILVTHFHADHSGLIEKIAVPGCKVYMSDIDAALLNDSLKTTDYWLARIGKYREEGFPPGAIEEAMQVNSIGDVRLAHLYYLEEKGSIRRELRGGLTAYTYL
jgi:glyoxylase-like metal-dependent hydrolase (beta-lactamase superfamily II)